MDRYLCCTHNASWLSAAAQIVLRPEEDNPLFFFKLFPADPTLLRPVCSFLHLSPLSSCLRVTGTRRQSVTALRDLASRTPKIPSKPET